MEPFPRYGFHVPEVTEEAHTANQSQRRNLTTPPPSVTIAPANETVDTGLWMFGQVEDTVLLPVLLALIATWCLLGNLLVIYSILGHRHMRTGLNLMLLNIAAADLVFILFTIPTAIVNHASFAYLSQVPGLHICKFVHYVTFVTVYVAIYTMVVMCVFRFCGEYMSDKGKTVSYLSRGNAILSGIVIWAAFSMSHLNFLLQPDIAIFQEPFICLQSDSLMDPMKLRTLWVTFLTCGFLLPLISISILSALILRKHSIDEGSLRTRRPDYYERVNIHATSHPEVQPERKKTVLLMTIMVVRTLCWVPIQVFVMVDIFGYAQSDTFYRKAEMLSVCVAFIGACINPLLYQCMYSEMQHAYKLTLIRLGCGACVGGALEDEHSDMNETIMSIISDSSNHINYQHS